MERAPGKLFIGEHIDPESGDRNGESLLIDSADLTTHGVIVGMTGSGKTGLGMVLLEEALVSGVPVLAIDPKGDLGNLALTFPDLKAVDFEPWIDERTARVKETTVAELAAATAETWRTGLESWGLDRTDVEVLSTAARPVIYTPGSTAGVQVNALGVLAVPTSDDPAARQDEADATISGLLGLVGVESDPLSGREHILLTNLVMRSWADGRDLDLPMLLAQVVDPPIRKLGVLDLETFFPADARQDLVLKLNGLVASPSFSTWAEGVPLDMERLLWDADGPRAAIMSLAHLDEPERHFALALILGRLITWMRTQPGTGELRVLVYIDEMMGLAPPVGSPAPKKPILTLMKQARAYGVGVLLSTQNPVDLDYKVISNAGTWMIGRLQTEQDKNRLVDGLRSADGTTDLGAVERLISRLGERQFVVRSTRNSDLPLLRTRWAMSYLAGPMTRDQIAKLMAGHQDSATAAAATSSQPAVPAPADDESTVPPAAPDDLVIRYAAPAAPWLCEIGGDPEGRRLEPALAARVNLLFDETKADLRHHEKWEAVIPLRGDRIDIDAAMTIDFDDRDLRADAPDNPRYVSPEFNLTKTALKQARSDLRARLHAEEHLRLFANREVKLWSRPGEDRDAFAKRCRAAADAEADADAEKLRTSIEKQLDRLEAALAKAEDRVTELEVAHDGRRAQSLIDVGTSVLGGLLGGRSQARDLASAARRMASSRSRTAQTSARLESAENRVAEKLDDLDELEAELQRALVEIDDEWRDKSEAIEDVDVPLERRDITIEDFVLVWIPSPDSR